MELCEVSLVSVHPWRSFTSRHLDRQTDGHGDF